MQQLIKSNNKIIKILFKLLIVLTAIIFAYCLTIVLYTKIIKFLSEKRINDGYKYAYLISNSTKENKHKSSILIADKSGKILVRKNMYKAIYHNLFIDSNGNISTIGEDEKRDYSFSYYHNQSNEQNLGKSKSGKICTGRSDFMFEIFYDNNLSFPVSLINSGYVNEKTYMFYLKTQNNCYEIPLVMNQFNYDKEKNQINIEGYKYSSSEIEQPEYLHYQIDLKENKLYKKEVINQEEYSPSIGSQYLKSYVKNNFVYSVIEYKDEDKSSIYLVKRDNEDYRIIDKKLIEVKEQGQNSNIIANFENDKLYYIRYSNGKNYLDIYDLDSKLIDSLNITKGKNKFESKYTKIRESKLHYVEPNKNGLKHYIYNIKTKKYEKILDYKFDYIEGQILSSFDINTK
ncbi:MAG: hypothetical protein RSE48_01075 [Bacilli bacterium]